MHHITDWLRKVWPVLLTAGVVIALDQWTKEWIRTTIPLYEEMPAIASMQGYFDWHHVPNYGAAFGILQNQGSFFIVIAFIVAIAILVYVRYLPMDRWFIRVLLGLQLGGAMGNVIDRINQGFVTDFIRMGIPGVYYWPNYNIADSAIVCGVIGLGIYVIWEDIQQQREQKALETSSETS